ncbi:MAG: glycosyltransferase [Leptolyngbyaceae cyanobacterium bins.302]|nr:glycosyltransferase [Leptolyngbyaceae cyanobacterium bins.302]
MTTTQLARLRLGKRSRQLIRPRLATLVMLGLVGLFTAISAAWFACEPTIQAFFHHLNRLQSAPPTWLEAPAIGYYLLAPTVILVLTAVLVMRLSPQPRPWSRNLVVGIMLVVTLRYVLWRSLSTLNLADPLNGTVSLGLFFLELITLAQTVILLVLMLWSRDRKREADLYSIAVAEGVYQPSVDVLIPTFNEPEFVLRRTIMGCQAMDYAHKTVYLLDDTRRPEIRQLAAELGCKYITRPDNRHAKAGNLNHAIAQTKGDMIAVFDADFVPTRNFLTRTIGFFQNPQIALVQTPQSYYNFDPVARNLGLENVLTPDEEAFNRQLQPIQDGTRGVICSGTSFVMRRSALEKAGGFVTETLSEDYFTGVRLAAKGYHVIYLDEKLSAGLAADSMLDYATQRFRWARGTLQAFFIRSNPLTIPGLSPLQRLAHLYTIITWLSNISWVGYLVVPLAYSFFGIIPLKTSGAEFIYFFLPFYILHLSVFSWLTYRSRSALMSNVYSFVIALPLAMTIIQILLAPFGQGFKVTPKGTSRDRFRFNWNLALPLLVLFAVTVMGLWHNLHLSYTHQWDFYNPDTKGFFLGWIWSIFNLFIISVALIALIDAPKTDQNEWFALQRVAELTLESPNLDQPLTLWGCTTKMSEGGAEILLTTTTPLSIVQTFMPVTMHLPEEDLTIEGTIAACNANQQTMRIEFKPLALKQQRQLVELLFCRPGQWKRQDAPGEWRSLWLMFCSLLRPPILFQRKNTIQALSVAQK